MPSAPTVSCPSSRRTWAVRSAPALTASSAGAAAAGLAHFHGTFASGTISALPGLLAAAAGPFRSTPAAVHSACAGCRACWWAHWPWLVPLPIASPQPDCAAGLRVGPAFRPLGCCPCPCLASGAALRGCPFRLVPAGWPHAWLPLRWLPHPPGLPPMSARRTCRRFSPGKGAPSGIAPGRFASAWAPPPDRPPSPGHAPGLIPTQEQEIHRFMAVTVSFPWRFRVGQFPVTSGCSHRSGESSK